jgi:hypothetical protein
MKFNIRNLKTNISISRMNFGQDMAEISQVGHILSCSNPYCNSKNKISQKSGNYIY